VTLANICHRAFRRKLRTVQYTKAVRDAADVDAEDWEALVDVALPNRFWGPSVGVN
jgi:hypothetical protein